MPRKKVIEEILMEDEKEKPKEENNCFAMHDGKCVALTHLTKQDKINCGTVKCPFYKPIEHINSVRKETAHGIEFETYEEYYRRTGKKYLKYDEIDKYATMPHD